LLSAWSRVLLEKPTDSQLVKKFPHPFHVKGRFITAFTTAHHLSLMSHMNPIQALILYFLKTKISSLSAFNRQFHFSVPHTNISTQWRTEREFAGSNPAEAVEYFSGEKILSMPSLGREVKPFAPCRRSVACKNSL
jgi:hypothetical protein